MLGRRRLGLANAAGAGAGAAAGLLNRRLGAASAAAGQAQIGLNSGKMGNDDSTNVMTRYSSFISFLRLQL